MNHVFVARIHTTMEYEVTYIDLSQQLAYNREKIQITFSQ